MQTWQLYALYRVGCRVLVVHIYSANRRIHAAREKRLGDEASSYRGNALYAAVILALLLILQGYSYYRGEVGGGGGGGGYSCVELYSSHLWGV